MARQIFVLALILVAIIGSVYAQESTATPAASTTSGSASAPVGDDPSIADAGGLSPSGDAAADGPAEGPIGETPMTSGPDMIDLPPSSSIAMGPSGHKSNGCTLKISASIAGVAAVSGFFFF